jgi:hypothetical protein
MKKTLGVEVELHAFQARLQMELCGQFYAPGTLFPKKKPPVSIE